MPSLRTAADDLARVSLPATEATSAHGRAWEAVLQQLLSFAEKYSGTEKLTGGDALDEMSAFDQLVESLRMLERRLVPEEFDAILGSVAQRSSKQARRVRTLRDRTAEALRVWRENLLARKAALAWPMNGRGLRVSQEVIASEMEKDPHDKSDLLELRERIAAASAGDPIQMGDISDTAERVLRLTVAVFETEVRRRNETLEGVRPLLPEDLKVAVEQARRADGSVDAILLGLALATDLGNAQSSTDRHLRLRRRQARFPDEGDDD